MNLPIIATGTGYFYAQSHHNTYIIVDDMIYQIEPSAANAQTLSECALLQPKYSKAIVIS